MHHAYCEAWRWISAFPRVLWAAVAHVNLIKVQGAAYYQKILVVIFYSSIHKLCLGCNWTFQHGSDQKHKAKTRLRWLQQNKVKVLEWTLLSPKFNITKIFGEILNVQFIQDNPIDETLRCFFPRRKGGFTGWENKGSLPCDYFLFFIMLCLTIVLSWKKSIRIP